MKEHNYNVSDYFPTDDKAALFSSRNSTEKLYRWIACYLDQLLHSEDPASIKSSNQVAELLIYGFFRDEEGGYVGGGLSNPDASVQLIFGVLKRFLASDRLLSAWAWTQLLPLLFEYAPHVQQWKDMQGFKMFCYLMHQKLDQSNWDLFSRCIYYAASEMGNVEMGKVTVIFVNSNEFRGLLTSMLTRMAPIWQANTAVLLSLARLLAAWRLQHPTLQAPVTLDLSTVVGSACNIAQVERHVVPQPAPLDLEANEFVQSDTTGYVYPTTIDPNTIDPALMTLCR